TVSGGGDTNAANNTANDVTTVNPGPDVTISKSHAGNFQAGETGANYFISVSNIGGGPPDGSTITVTDNLPSPLSATTISGSGWNCLLGTLTCTRSDALQNGAGYPQIVLTVNVPGIAPASVTNTVTVSGGSDLNPNNNTANDPTTIISQASAITSANNTTF